MRRAYRRVLGAVLLGGPVLLGGVPGHAAEAASPPNSAQAPAFAGDAGPGGSFVASVHAEEVAR